jgi:hypothetical protein
VIDYDLNNMDYQGDPTDIPEDSDMDEDNNDEDDN